MFVLSHFQAAKLLQARATGAPTICISTDLELTQTQAALSPEGILLPDGKRLWWEAIEQIAKDENGCYWVEHGEVSRIQLFSPETGRVYSLYPTASAPTMLLSGVTMHRIKETDPRRDTLAKIKAVGAIRGRVLDTCTGLGYTALEAARFAHQVITVELDPAVHEIMRRNPWSNRLFDTPNVTPIIGDVADVIVGFEDESFSCIIHDPPRFSLAGELYSTEFYRCCLRVLQRSGKMFHYIGNPENKSAANVTRGVARRLQEAGFRRVLPRPEAFGVLALK